MGIWWLRSTDVLEYRSREQTMGFARFMSSTAGRAIRVIAGIALIVIGGLLGGGWWALAVVGLVPLAAGVLDFCLFAPLFGQPLSGKAIRK
jgi:hypothetical protein